MSFFRRKNSVSDEKKPPIVASADIPPAVDSASVNSESVESADIASVNSESVESADIASVNSASVESADSGSVDSVIRVRIIENGLQACLYIEPPIKNGAGPTVDSMMAALSNAGVTYNIDMEKLKELEAKPVFYKDVVVATGIPPVNGEDGKAEFLFDVKKDSFKPKENEDGTVDFRDLDQIQNVTKGQVLCRITHPTEGKPGMSVLGMELKQKKGKPAPALSGKNTMLSEDGTAIISKIDGQVDFVGGKINVSNIYIVRGNVDVSTGNIKVAGSLIVRGMVTQGFTIEAAEDIEVSGTIESATVIAGGNIWIKSGITGSEISAGGNIKCKFIENCKVFAKGEVSAEYILNSEIKCAKDLKITGRRARIIGGSCLVGSNIEAATIGSPSNVKTKLVITNEQAILGHYQELSELVPVLEKQIESLKPLYNLLKQMELANRLTPEKREIYDNVSKQHNTTINKLEEVKRKLDEIINYQSAKGYGKVICTGTIYPGTEIVIGNDKYNVNEPLQFSSFYFYKGEICLGPAR
ncbi:MAG TPA: DUF342 domain-containing protein [Clostridiales bacterium]|nr:DUF342 domain-containing protein [Clostridiales bacterium]